MKGFTPIILLALLWASAALAQNQAASDLSLEIETLQQQSIEAARTAQNLEAELNGIETTLRGLRDEEAIKATDLSEQSTQLTRLLGALQRLALQPPEALFATPGAPIDTVRSAMLLSEAVPALEARAAALKRDLEELAQVRQEIVSQREALELRGRQLAEELARLDEVLAQKQVLEAQTRREAEARQAELEAEAAAKEVKDTGELVASLPSGPRLSRPDALRAFPSQPGGVLSPARGQIVARYGERTEIGFDELSKGLIVETRPAARVVAPFDGEVVYSGPFRRYGLILIIEHEGQYHSLLSGMNEIDVVVGQWLLAGEPVGEMSSLEGRNPTLYYELRRQGQPIDPLPWLESIGQEAEG